jgi:hypothetical protein
MGATAMPGKSAAQPSEPSKAAPTAAPGAIEPGFIAGGIMADLSRDAKTTAGLHNYKPGEGQVLILEGESTTPEAVAPGHVIKGTVHYALLGAGPNGAIITETRELTRNDKLVGVSTHTVRRTEGTWVSTQDFRLPPNAPPGEYKLTQRVETPRAKVAGESLFQVSESMAKAEPPSLAPSKPQSPAPEPPPATNENESRRPMYAPG